MTKLKNEPYIKLLSDGFMPLTFERLEGQIRTAYGIGELFSLAHYYKQNGDAMRDPEMLFLVVDLRTELQGKEEYLFIFPVMYQQDNLGVYEESVVFENSTVKNFKPHWQKAHANFANSWLSTIHHQAFLK